MLNYLKWGQPLIQATLILERGSNGLLFLLLKELRRIQNSSVKGCGNYFITLGEKTKLKKKQTQAPFDPWIPISLGLFWVDLEGEASLYLPAILSKVCLGMWSLFISIPNFPYSTKRSHLLIYFLPNIRNLRAQLEKWEKKAEFVLLHFFFPHIISDSMFYCFQDFPSFRLL